MTLFVSYDATDSAEARAVVAKQISDWHLSAVPVLAWFDQADAALPAGAVANVEVSYHPADRLLSFDVWADDQPVFGLLEELA